MSRHRFRGSGPGRETSAPADRVIEVDPAELSGVFRPPDWLRDAGMTSWLLVGIALLAAALVTLLALTQTIVLPVITAAIVAAVASPVVAWMSSKGLPRALGAATVLLGIVGVVVGMFLLVFGGITAQAGDVSGELNQAKDAIGGWLTDLGISSGDVEDAKKSASAGLSESYSTLIDGVLSGVARLSSLAFFLALTTLSLFFLLKDGPTIRNWVEGRLGLPRPVAQITTGRILGSLRGYFLGVTIVAPSTRLW